jgi:sec-independent protein translocase protein TatB
VFGINPSEFIVLLAVAAVVLGPERLPEYAQQLARLVRELRRMAQGASAQVRDELGPEFDDIDWRKLDPRQYDPRRIVREALSDVWDPEDPLGLKAGNRPQQSDDYESQVEKPVSTGGPVPTSSRWGQPESNGAESTNGAEPTNGAQQTKGAEAEPGPPVAFDPDAT